MKVQISHRGQTDQKFAQELHERLDKMGIIVRRDYLYHRRAQADLALLGRDLQAYDFVIAILSKGYFQSTWLPQELFGSMVLEVNRREQFLIPVLVEDCEVPSFIRKDHIIDFRNVSFDQAFDALTKTLTGRKQLFVIMKFGDRKLDQIYTRAMRPAALEFGYTVLRINEVPDSGVISDQILRQIERSAVILADLTGERPNCYFEAGYAHALGKEMILTIKGTSQIHFDLSAHRFIRWNTEEELKQDLMTRFKAIQERELID